MISRCLILAFLLSIVGDSLAAVAPYMDGEGCSARCCQAARQSRRGANLSKLRCIVDCNESRAANTPSRAVGFIDRKDRKIDAGLSSVGAQSALLCPAIALRIQNSITIGSPDIYLRTGTLLI
jgi:hypothetical protein